MIYLTFVSLYIWFFRTFFIDLAWFAHLVDHHSWAFGQIVAITVWAGPLCEYIHLELRECTVVPMLCGAPVTRLTPR